jgi:hypothetical protein
MGGKTKTSWKPGQSGNPNGAPKKELSAVHLMREIGKHRREMKIQGKKEDVSFIEAVLFQLYSLAQSGDVPAIKLLLAYLEGSPIQRTELTGAEGKPFLYNPKLDDIK